MHFLATPTQNRQKVEDRIKISVQYRIFKKSNQICDTVNSNTGTVFLEP